MSNRFSNAEMLSRVAGFSQKYQLLDSGHKYVVALSGGADSVALLLVMKALEYDVEAAHCNFHLRGKESERDEAFCVSLCKEHNITLHRVHFETAEYASLHKISVEMAARDLRYAYFEQLRNDINADDVCVAHHKDDNVETILLNIVRGTGLNGLTGMSPRNGHILRPLLCVGRSEILQFLDDIGQSYVTDSSNLVDDVQRNKMRLNVIPLLEQINPAVKDNILNMANWTAEASLVVGSSLRKAEEKLEHFDNGIAFDVSLIERFSSPEYLLWHILNRYGFNRSQVSQVLGRLHANSGTSWLSASHELVLDRARLIVVPIGNAVQKQMRIPEEGVYVYSEGVKIKVEKQEISENYIIARTNNKACLDADNVKFPLIIRRVAIGDRFVPFGMKGSKLVSDFLTDQKVPLPIKRSQLVVTDAGGDILWVVGRRVDGRNKLTRISKVSLEISLLS